MAKKNNTSKVLRGVLIFIALLGVAIMGYLLNLHFSSDTGGSFCDLGEGLSCDIVNKSIYAKIFGIPMSVLGLLYFIGIFGVALFKYEKQMLRMAGFLSIVFLGPSLYLTAVEIYIINSICIFCEASKILILLIASLTLIASRPLKLGVKGLVYAVVTGALLAGITYYAHTQVVPSGRYETFAKCLYGNGMRMYGSAGCSFCAKQRAIFGDAIHQVHEIECDPRHPNPQVALCLAKDIEHTPTWILEDGDGNNIRKMEPGVLSLEELSEISGCELTKDN
jgi:uncharacterized membrane protein